MPDPDFGELSHAEDIREAERVHLLALKLVGPLGLFQSELSRVSVLSENNDPHVGVGARPWGRGWGGVTLLESKHPNSCLPGTKTRLLEQRTMRMYSLAKYCE